MTNSNLLLSLKNISKSFPGVKALNKVSFDLCKGEVHALVGENGAGKSTLVKIVTGILKKDDGEIKIKGHTINLKDAHHARILGIAAIFQELSLIPTLTAAENIFLGQEYMYSKMLVNRKRMVNETEKILKKYNIDINPRAIISDLSAAKRQLVETIKAVSLNPDILIMDEPTSSLTLNEAESLFKIIKDFKRKDGGIIYISHRMDEVCQISDRVAVLRDGNLIDDLSISNLDVDKVINLMVGREIEIYAYSKRSSGLETTKVVLEIKNLSSRGKFSNVSFDLRKGEILGIAGLVGSGRSELAMAIFGIDKYDSGEIILNNLKVEINNVRDALKLGIALIPESKQLQGLILMHNMEKNIILPTLKNFSSFGFINYKKTNKFVKQQIDKFDIKPKNPNIIVENLSGGNQQKVVISKWISTNPQILIVDEPTAGIDVRTKSEIHRLIRKLSNSGISIIMISSELPELLTHSDRIMIMNNGNNLGIFNHNEVNQEKVMSIIMEDIIKRKNIGKE